LFDKAIAYLKGGNERWKYGWPWPFQLPMQLSKMTVLWFHWAWCPCLCGGWKRLPVLLGCRRGL
jgi:hypothetical protein